MRTKQKTSLIEMVLRKGPIFSFVAVLLFSLSSMLLAGMLFVGKAYAISGQGAFKYTGANYSTITETGSGNSQVYEKSTSGHGVYYGGAAEGFDANSGDGGCSAFLQTKSHKYNGDTRATWWASCLGGVRKAPGQPGKRNITIKKLPHYVASWVDHNHIELNGTIYYDSKTDNNDSYVAQGQSNGCPANVIDNFPHKGGNPANAGSKADTTLTVNAPISITNKNCATNKYPVYFDNTQNYSKYFVWVDSGTIQTSDRNTMTFTQNGKNGPFLDSGSAKCKTQIKPDAGNPKRGTLIIRYSGSNPYDEGYSPQFYQDGLFHNNSGCQVSKPLKVNIANPKNANSLPPGSGNTGGGGSLNDDGPACEYSANALSWIICPVVQLLELAIEKTDKVINDELNIPQDDIFCTDKETCNSYYTAWSSFRNISLGLLAIAGLITVISQAIGMEILDAYTIRKILPRILVAAIGITLSWTLMSFAVTLANNLGYGVRDLILSPFHGVLESSHIGFSGNAGALIGGFAAFVLGGIAAIAAIGILISYLATAGLAVLIAIAVLVLRQIVIIMLMILSPIAFIAYVLPNTQRVFKLWWESFSKALLMFPLIAAFLAAGKVFAAISLDGSQSLFTQLTALVAYFGPYFAIPLTFRMSGGIMSGVGNFVQRAGQPVGGMLQGYRSNKAKERIAAGKAGTLFEPKRWIPGSTAASGAINEAAKGIGLGWKGRYGLGQRGKEARGGALLTAAGELGKDPRMQSIGGYNDANRILAEGMGSERRGREALFKHLTKDGGDDGKTFLSPEEAQAKVDKAAKAAKAAGGFTRTHGLAALHSMARDGTAIRDTDDLARMAALAGAGDRNATFTTAADLAKTSGQAGRPDLAAASEPIGELAFAHSDSTFGGKLYSSGGREKAEEDMDKLQYAAWESGAGGESAYSVLNSGKSRSVRFPAQYAMGVVKNKRGTYSQEQRQQAAAFLTHTQQGIDSGYGKPNNIKQFRDIIGTPENANALQEFMSQPAQVQEQTQTVRVSDRQPQVETRTVQGTNADIVGGLVSRRGSMSQDQMAAEAASHQDQAQAEEQNQNQEQG